MELCEGPQMATRDSYAEILGSHPGGIEDTMTM
jgi:hypothetical protein